MTTYWKWRETNGPPPCAGHIELFYPYDGKAGRSPMRIMAEQHAKNICRTCPAIALCFEASIVREDGERRVEPGIWAGLDQVERCQRTGLNPVQGTGTKYAFMVAQKARRRHTA